MSKKSQYITIEPPFSVNKLLDNTSRERPSGNFFVLKNYIPANDILRTREGITVFAHTPSTTPSYIPSDDPACLIWLRFEGANFQDCEIQGPDFMSADITNSFSPTTTNYTETSYSLYTNYNASAPGGGGVGTWYSKLSSELPANFPGEDSPDSNCIISFWMRTERLAANAVSMAQHDTTTLAGGWVVQASLVGANYKFACIVTNSAGTTRTAQSTVSVQTYRWYHIALWSSKNVGTYGCTVYDSNTAGVETFYPNVGPTTIGGDSLANGRFWVGGNRQDGILYIDDFILLNDAPPTEVEILSKIERMRTRLTLPSNDFTGDSDVVALYNFENDLSDSIGGYTLSAPGTAPSYSNNSRQGTTAGSFSAANTEYGSIADATIGGVGSGFPGKNGESPTSFSICCWVKVHTIASRKGIVCKLNSGGGAMSFAVAMETTQKIRFTIGYNGGASSTELDTGAALDLNTWYHVACTYTTGAPYSMKIRARHVDGTLVGGANATGVAGGEFSPDSAPFEIGRHNIANGTAMDGLIDEVVIFKRALSDADIDSIFYRTFS